MTTTANEDTTGDHTNANTIEETSTARMAGQCHKNENNPKFTSN